MFTLTINTDDPIVLANIAKAIANTPPAGFVSVDGGVMPDQPVIIHATEAKKEEAKAAVVKKESTKVKEEPIPEPEPTPPPAATADSAEIGQRLRELLLAVSKLDGKTIADAKQIAATGAGVDVTAINKDFPSHPKAADAIAALEASL